MKQLIPLTALTLTLTACSLTTTPPDYSNVNQPEQNQSASIPADLESAPTFTHPTFNYTIKLPETLTMEELTPNSIQFISKSQQPGPGPANFIYISTITPELRNTDGQVYNYNPNAYIQLQELEIGQSTSLADPDQPDVDQYFTYTRVDDTSINGQPVQVYENNQPWEFPPGTTETRYYLESGDNLYLLGYYTGGEGVSPDSSVDPRLAHPVIHSFQP